MGLFDGSMASGGSVNSSQSASDSISYTNGREASEWSAKQAQIAREWQEKMYQIEREYNAAQAENATNINIQEAQKLRNWQQSQVDIANQMANTVYSRSMKDMKESGINPILAAFHGLGAAGSGSIASGAAANALAASTSAPSGFMAQTFPDQYSASKASSEANGRGWDNSTSGLATALENMGKFVGDGLSAINAGSVINFAMKDMEKISQEYDKNMNEITSQDDKYSDYRNKIVENNKKAVGDNPLLKLLNNLQIKATGILN